MLVKLVSTTPEGEKIIAHCARVSSPNQENPEYEKLLSYLIKNNHWSPFEMANLCVEITTTRGVAPQILRHKSFSFQEFSQRYAEALTYEPYEARRQDLKNRQNSIDDMNQENKEWFGMIQELNWETSLERYKKALEFGVAKELARTLLPLGTETKLYMNGSIRSWIHYIEVRSDPSTQKEHRDIAEACKKILIEHYPTVAKAMNWS